MPETRSSSPERTSDSASHRDWLMAILDSLDHGIYLVDRDYRIRFMNRTLRSIVGDGEGQLCHEFFGHDRATCDHCQHGMSSFGPELQREWVLAEPPRTFEIVVSPIHEPDGSISRLHLVRDISERKQLEARLQQYTRMLETQVAEQADQLARRERLALLGEISAGLAHEIRTPLGAIITGIRLIERGTHNPDDRALVFDLLKRETTRLQKKVSEFLAYAKPRLPQRSPTSVHELLEQVRSILEADPAATGESQLNITVQPDLPLWPLDAEQIKEALLNIALNAVQALAGTGSVALDARSFHPNVLEITVRDSGPGISQEALPHIFKPFFSLRPQGTGLGLAITKEIIEAHGGHITVTSRPQLGTSFRITLPLRLP